MELTVRDLLERIPVPAWLQAVRNLLGFYGIGLIFLFVLLLVVYLYPAGFTSTQRVQIILVLVGAFVFIFLLGTFLAALPGDRHFSPTERAQAQALIYGTSDRPQRRRRVLAERAIEAPDAEALIEGHVEAPKEPGP